MIMIHTDDYYRRSYPDPSIFFSLARPRINTRILSAMGCVSMDAIDSFYVPEDQDEGGPRMYWRVLKCPRCDECSDQAWNRVQAWSFISEDIAKDVVIKHLVNSSKHAMDEETAETYREDMEIEVLEETEAERKSYREQIDRIEKNKRKTQWEEPSKDSCKGSVPRCKARQKGKDGKGGDGKGKGYDKGAEIAVITNLPLAQRPTLNTQSLGMVVDCIDRSRGAVTSAISMFTKTAEALTARAHACTSTSAQLQDELNTLTAAKECVQEIQRRLS